MRLLELGALYAAVGVGAVLFARSRGLFASPGDPLLFLFAWPLFVPVALSRQTAPATHRGSTGATELARTLEAVDAVADPALRAILPSRETLERLAARVDELADRARESKALAGDLGASSHERAARARLLDVAARCEEEQLELAALLTRLRTTLHVVRLSSGPADDVRALALALADEIEGIAEGWAR